MRGRYRNDHYEGYWSDPELGYRRARRRTPRYRPSGKRRDRYRRYAGRHPRYRYQYIAYDAGASEPRRRSRGWRRYLRSEERRVGKECKERRTAGEHRKKEGVHRWDKHTGRAKMRDK